MRHIFTFRYEKQNEPKGMKISWSPDQQKIINVLKDFRWHCLDSKNFYMKDNRTRISEINAKLFDYELQTGQGWKIISFKCDKRCGTNHSSRIQMRRLMRKSDIQIAPKEEKQLPLYV